MTISPLGTIGRNGGLAEVRFERNYPRPVETVWAALTDPERLADWMGIARVEPFVGGQIELMLDGPFPMTGQVRVWEPPHVLEYSWSNAHAPNSIARYELRSQDGGTSMIFTHKKFPDGSGALMLPGWHTYFNQLERLLGGEGDGRSWRALQAAYIDRYHLHGMTLDP